jgi:lysophospholipase L1-like esterase
LGGQRYVADFATNREGFRVFGSNAKAPFRILVLGDSFTADPYGSDDKMWYGKMAERLAAHMHRPQRDFYVLAGGGGGWGTYQELLLSQRIAHTVKPNLFVLQFCSNDFQNNSYEWESKSVTRGQWMRRPFWNPLTGKTRYAPGILPILYRSVLGETRLFSRTDSVMAGIQFKRYGGYFEPLPPDVTAKYERDSIALTRLLLTKLRQEYNGIPAVMVNCDGDESGPNKRWANLARDAGFIPLAGPSDFLRSLKDPERKTVLNSDGSHLSNVGNQRYGAIAGDELASLRLLN